MEIKENDAIYFLPKNVGQTIDFQSINKVFQIFNIIGKTENNKNYFTLLFSGNELTLLLKERIGFIANKRYIGYPPSTFKHIKASCMLVIKITLHKNYLKRKKIS